MNNDKIALTDVIIRSSFVKSWRIIEIIIIKGHVIL